MHRTAGANIFKMAGQNRKLSTEAELKLWECLRDRKLNGLKFRRQHPIGGFIVDFYCAKVGLAIEVDGGYHNDAEQQAADERRTIELNKLNVKVIRFTNHEVLTNINEVQKQILEYS